MTPGLGRGLPAALLGAVLLCAGRDSASQSAEESLLPGQVRERPIAMGEAHAYRVAVGEEPLLVTVEQQSIDLVLEVQEPSGQGLKAAGDGRWGPRVLLLAGAGE